MLTLELWWVALLLTIGAVAGAVAFGRRLPIVRQWTDIGHDWLAALAPRFLTLATFLAGAILLLSGATPPRGGRLGWVNDLLPLPLLEASAYFTSLAGVALIVLARGIQHRLDAAYHLTVLLLGGGIVFALASAWDVEQAVVLSAMLAALLSSRRFFYRKASMFEERFTPGWIAAIAIVLLGTLALTVAKLRSADLGAHVFWQFGEDDPGPRAVRALALAVVALTAFAAARLIRPARVQVGAASAPDLDAAAPLIAESNRASAHLAYLGDKALMFNEPRTAFIMYGIAGRSWVALGDPVGSVRDAVALIDQFIHECDRRGGWPVFYRVSPPLLHLYLDYGLAAVKLGEVARVPLTDFSLEGPKRRNLRRVWRKAVDDGCTFEMVPPAGTPALLDTLRAVSDEWLLTKRAREKAFSLGCFDERFVTRSPVGVVRRAGRVIAFVTLWPSGQDAEVEVDLMRHVADAPAGIMRYALIEAMTWARDRGYAWFNLGAAPLSGIRSSAVTPIWNKMALAVRGAGERYYNFKGLREFKDWFYPEWEPTFLVSPGGTKRPIILANISALISGSYGAVFRR